MSNDNLGDRIKGYENAYRISLPMRMPIIIRVDGCHFHSYTKGCQRPFDLKLIEAMNTVAITLCQEIQGAKLAYVQSDEISVLLNNYTSLNFEPWFSNNLQKMVSVAAGIASSVMTEESIKIFGAIKRAEFDARAFLLPKEEVCNALLFRQQDATRNSVQMLARSLHSHKECTDKNNSELQEMIFQKGMNWNDLPAAQKRGRCIIKEQYDKEGVLRSRWIVDENIPIFSQDRNYIEQHVFLLIE